VSPFEIVYGGLLAAVGVVATIFWYQFRKVVDSTEANAKGLNAAEAKFAPVAKVEANRALIADLETKVATQGVEVETLKTTVAGLPNSDRIREVVVEVLSPLKDQLKTGFDQIDRRFDTVEKDIGQVEERIHDIEIHGTPRSRELSKQQQEFARRLADEQRGKK
jgi:hypothetical protein